MFNYVHPALGPLRGCEVHEELVQFRSVPYASIARRFARAQVLKCLPRDPSTSEVQFDASKFGPSSIQPSDSIKTDIGWNQLPEHPQRLQAQDEDCLRITLTVPRFLLTKTLSDGVPVVTFIHGGALFVGSGERQYYDPVRFCLDALWHKQPLIFASINYRLGALGFLHCPEVIDILPPNNGLYDQILAFEWIQSFVAGFGGDVKNVTAIGQSAGAASLSLHNTNPRNKPMYRRSIILSGSSTVLVTMSPEEHRQEFYHQASKLGIPVSNKSAKEVAYQLLDAPLDAIRKLEYTGAPCSESELIPDRDWATMYHAQKAKPNSWLESQILGSSTFDGSISYMVEQSKGRKHRARIFTAICKAKLKHAQSLLDLYHISSDEPDDVALEKICQVVTDIGFYAAAVSSLSDHTEHGTKSCLLLFDIPNPFPGSLPQGRFATHTWDIVSLLGAYDDQVPASHHNAIKQWRATIIDYCYAGKTKCEPWRRGKSSAIVASMDGVDVWNGDRLSETRAEQMLDLARKEGGEHGFDLLWEDVIRFYLKTANARYTHELEAVIGRENMPPELLNRSKDD